MEGDAAQPNDPTTKMTTPISRIWRRTYIEGAHFPEWRAMTRSLQHRAGLPQCMLRKLQDDPVVRVVDRIRAVH